MSASPRAFEAVVLDSVLPQFEADGFTVLREPARTLLPGFLHACRPDAVALKGDRKIAIEVARPSAQAAAKLEHLRRSLAAHADWEFQVVYAPPLGTADCVAVQSRTAIEEELRRVAGSFDHAGPVASGSQRGRRWRRRHAC